MDNVKTAQELVRVAKSLLSSVWSRQAYAEWDKFIKFVKNRYPNASVKVEDRRTGDAIEESLLTVNGERLAKFKGMGYEGSLRGLRHSFLLWGGSNYKELFADSGKVIPFSDMKNVFEQEIDESKDQRLGEKSLTSVQGEKMKSLVLDALKTVRGIAEGVDGRIIFQNNDYQSKVFVVVDWEGGEPLLVIDYDIMRNRYELKMLGASVHRSNDIKDFVKALKSVGRTFKKQLSSLGKFESGLITGNINVSNVVKSIGKPKSRFEEVDEWFDTELTVPVVLSTSSDVPEGLMRNWVKENWNLIMRNAPSNTPRSSGIGFTSPNDMRYNDIEEFRFEQTGRKGLITFSTTRRD